MHTTPSQEEIASTLSHLELSTKVPQKPAKKPKSKPVADSWDDDLSASDTEKEEDPKAEAASPRDSLDPISTVTSTDMPPQPPPPTPASPAPFDFPGSASYSAPHRANSNGRSAIPERRPEKTTAVASRLIAGALGVRAPRRTEEEREYDKAMREKERKRREAEKDKERQDKELAEAQKKAMWDD